MYVTYAYRNYIQIAPADSVKTMACVLVVLALLTGFIAIANVFGLAKGEKDDCDCANGQVTIVDESHHVSRQSCSGTALLIDPIPLASRHGSV